MYLFLVKWGEKLGVIRVPVSLKFTEDDFYLNHIEPLKEGKGLSSFIVTLLKLYYTNEVIKDEVDRCQQLASPFTEIKSQIERITLEHEKTVMAIGGLKDFVRSQSLRAAGEAIPQTGVREKLEDGKTGGISERVEELEKILPYINDNLYKLVKLRLAERIDDLEKAIPSITDKIKNTHKLEGDEDYPDNTPIVVEEATQTSELADTTHTRANDEIIQDSSDILKDTDELVGDIDTKQAYKSDQKVKSSSEGTVSSKISAKGVDNVNKPKSFGKLMRSLKNV